MSFVEKLDPEALRFFNEVAAKPFAQQGVAFLNAYWPEVGSQSEFIFTYVARYFFIIIIIGVGVGVGVRVR
jgi:hypothetical protein